MKSRLIVIAGPTASGKTAAAVELCKRNGGEVVSADSMQLYRGMDILSAKPTPEELDGVPHHMLGVAEPWQKYTAARYRDEAKTVISNIYERGAQPVLCGGTGLYIDAVTKAMEFSERCDEDLRKELFAIAEEPGGRRRLHTVLSEIDPEAASRLHENDVRRVTRAIEVYRLTGRTQSEQAREDALREGDYDVTLFALDWPRDELYRRIDLRVDRMMETGLVDEVRTLMRDERNHPTAMQAIGYKEIAAALQGSISMDEAVALVKQRSRNYAKKQLTWFRRDPRTVWLNASGKTASELAEEMLQYMQMLTGKNS